MRMICIFMLLSITSCGKKSDQSPSPTIASIPQGCNIYTSGGSSNGQGWHGFLDDGSLRLVTAYDCGMREGQRCFYYVAVDLSKNDTICQIP